MGCCSSHFASAMGCQNSEEWPAIVSSPPLETPFTNLTCFAALAGQQLSAHLHCHLQFVSWSAKHLVLRLSKVPTTVALQHNKREQTHLSASAMLRPAKVQ